MGKVVKDVAISVALYYVGGAALSYLNTGAASAAYSVKTLQTLRSIATAVQSLAVGKGLSGVASLFAPKAQGGQLSPSAQIEYAGTVEARRIVYGTTVISGMNAIPPWANGAQNDLLHQVIVLSGHELDAITDVYFNQDKIVSANIGAITGTIADGAIGTGTYAGKAWIRRYTGTSSQTVDFILNNGFAVWDSNHRGRGIAYVALTYKYDQQVFSNGKPEVRITVRGRKVYDPRKDSTNGGSGAHRLATPSTWEYSANPALCLADYLTDTSLGLGESQSRVDWAMVAAAATICDQTVNIPGGLTQPRYTISAVFDCTQPYEDTITTICAAMMGSVTYSGGLWRMYAGAARSSEFTIGDDDVIGNIEFRTAIPYKERWNAVRGQFLDPSTLYTPAEYPLVRVSADETSDGEGPIWKEVNFSTCADIFEAQRNAIILQKLSRRKKRWVINCGLSAYKIRPGEWGTLNLSELGISGQLVKCVEWSFTPAGAIQVTLDEVATADWNDPATGTYTTPGAVTGPTQTQMVPDNVTGVTVAGQVDGVLVSWTPPANAVPGTVYQVTEHTASTPYSSSVAVGPRTAQSSIFLPRTSTATRYYWVYAIFPNGQTSAGLLTSTAGVAGAPLSITGGFRITVTPGYVYASGTTASVTTGAATVTPIGAVGAVTYTWTRQSGDASTTISSSSSATPTWTRGSMVAGTTYSSVWRVSAFDTATTVTFDVNVEIFRDSLQ